MKFDEIVGNKEAKDYLLKCAGQNRVSQSYLFLGTDGIGKKMIAKEFAKKILCLEAEKKDDCLCKSCQCLEGGNHPDYVLINEDGETIKIDQVREITKKAMEQPIVSDKKVYIINDSDKMTLEAQNCLLKTLEEPPEFLIILLISSNENAILNTIQSRCMTIHFKPISNDELKKYAMDKLEVTQMTENLLKSFNGSIGKAIRQIENQGKFLQIENFIHNMKVQDRIHMMNEAKIMYDKENIDKILDYMMIGMYAKVQENREYVNCIDKINQARQHLKRNCNFDMTIDTMLFEMWECLQKGK